MSLHGTIGRLGWSLGDVQDVGPYTSTVGQSGAARAAHRPPGPQVISEFVPQFTAGLHEQRR
jgi:hypothetical protein